MSDKIKWRDAKDLSDHIIALEASLKAAEAERDQIALACRYEADVAQQAIDAMKDARAERDALAEKLERAVEALLVYSDPCEATEITSCGFEGNMCCMAARKALATLAALEDKTDV